MLAVRHLTLVRGEKKVGRIEYLFCTFYNYMGYS